MGLHVGPTPVCITGPATPVPTDSSVEEALRPENQKTSNEIPFKSRLLGDPKTPFTRKGVTLDPRLKRTKFYTL